MTATARPLPPLPSPAGALRVLFVASEAYPLIKTGGLADVAGALPAALRTCGVDVRLLLPGYPTVLAGIGRPVPIDGAAGLDDQPLPGGVRGRLLAATTADGVPIYILDAPTLYDRPGTPYVGHDGADWPDNALRFGALSAVAARFGLAPAGLGGFRPQVIHGHDWQTGLMPAYLRLTEGNPTRRPATVFTVHNIAYQGRFPAYLLGLLQLPPYALQMHGVEYHGDIGYLKAGVYYADRITTVSPRYAREIQSTPHGEGLEGLLAARRDALTGILNGIDTALWDPARDPLVPARYGADRLAAKAVNRAALAGTFGLTLRADAPMVGMVSRLTWHKGIDLLLAAAPALLEAGGRLIVLGTGDPGYETALRRLAAAWPTRVGVRIGYDETLAHRIQAGVDALAVPSRAEPCGLTQLYALRYGTVPVVGRVGGLADTVIDANPAAVAAGVATGFQVSPVTADELAWTFAALTRLFCDRPAWQRMQRAGMTQDFGWPTAAARYRDLYAAVAVSP